MSDKHWFELAILDTLEKRREQITNKSTICLAASSGLLLFVMQFSFAGEIPENNPIILFFAVSSLLSAVCAMLFSIDLIRTIGRRKVDNIGRLFYFKHLSG